MAGVTCPGSGGSKMDAVELLARFNMPMSHDKLIKTYARMVGQAPHEVRDLVECQLDPKVQYGCVMRLDNQFAAIPVGTFVLANDSANRHVNNIEDATWKDFRYHTGQSMKFLWCKTKLLGSWAVRRSSSSYDHLKHCWICADVGRRCRGKLRKWFRKRRSDN